MYASVRTSPVRQSCTTHGTSPRSSKEIASGSNVIERTILCALRGASRGVSVRVMAAVEEHALASDELAFAGIARQVELVRAGEVSPRELVDAHLERIERLDGELNAFRVVYAERAR